MPDEPTLFDDQARRRPDATDRQKVVYEDDADEDGAPVDAEAVAAAALSALEEEGERDTVRAEYARLLWSAARGGISLQADNGEYVAV